MTNSYQKSFSNFYRLNVRLLLVGLAFSPGAHVQADSLAEIAQVDVEKPVERGLLPKVLDNSDALVGSITINNGSIFDLENPAEDKLLYRFANKAHITTRPQVIEQQLLFSTGDSYSSQQLEESERILRSNRYIQEAQIEPIRHANGVVDINVTTSDTWTLAPKLSFSHSGGESSSSVGIKEMNMLGTGMGVEALYTSDVDRDSKVLKIVDRHIGDSWYGIKAIIEDNSDGHTRQLAVGKPFYAMDSTSAHGVSLFDNDRIDALYDRGEVAARFRHQSKTQELYVGWSKGLQNGWARRYTAGLGYDEHLFSSVVDERALPNVTPDDRRFVYPFVGIEVVQDKYEESTNFDHIERVEDRFLGTAFSFKLGRPRTGLGSDRNAWLLNAAARTSFSMSKKSTLFLSSTLASRWDSNGAENLALTLDAKYYRRQSEKRLMFARLSGTFGHDLDLDQQLFLGGDNGLRGYPLRYQSGDKRALFTFEQRFFTDWYPFRLFRVGAAVFFDVGRTWGEGPFGTANDGLLKDVGAGLRLGNARSGLGRMIHVDVAYPLDGNNAISNVQFIVELKQSF